MKRWSCLIKLLRYLIGCRSQDGDILSWVFNQTKVQIYEGFRSTLITRGAHVWYGLRNFLKKWLAALPFRVSLNMYSRALPPGSTLGVGTSTHPSPWYISLVYPPWVVSGLQGKTTPFIQLRSVTMCLAIDGGVDHGKSSFPHHLFHISIAEWVSQIPPTADEDELAFAMVALKGIVWRDERYRNSPGCRPTSTDLIRLPKGL